MTDNVVNFPNSFSELHPSTLEESKEHINAVRQHFCDEVSADATEAFISVLSAFNIHIKPEEHHVKDYVFLEEAVKALVYRYKNLPHSFHEIIDSVITLTDEAIEDLEKRKQSQENS